LGKGTKTVPQLLPNYMNLILKMGVLLVRVPKK